jgi:teichuronic acid biosynthesis glycosyltransferase TuaH
VTTQRVDHWIVNARRLFGEGDILYRRDRLARYLATLPETDRVYWIHPQSERWEPKVAEMPNGIWLVGLPDNLAGFGRFRLRAPVPRGLDSHLGRSGVVRVLWFTHPIFPWLARVDGWEKTVYDCSDLWHAWRSVSRTGGRIDWKARGRQRWLVRAERAIVERSAHVVATTDDIADHLMRSYGRSVDAVIENGVDFARFANAGASVAETSNRLVYVGSCNAKLDFELLERLGRSLRDAQIVLAGPVSRLSQGHVASLTRLPNVNHIGTLAPDQIPDLLTTVRVGLIPYADTEYSRAGSPNKLFEYLAAGVPVVSFGISVGANHHEPGIYFHAEDHDSFIRECGRLLEHPDTDAEKAARQLVARRNDWGPKLESIVSLVFETPRPPL